MNKLKLYNQFINEGVRDQMTPKSEDDIRNAKDKIKTEFHKIPSRHYKIEYLAKNFNRSADDVYSEIQNFFGNYPDLMLNLTDMEFNGAAMHVLDDMLDESIRSKMTPKSEEEILKSVDKLKPNEKLLLGCQQGILWLVKDAIKQGANYNHYLPISQASKEGHIDIVEYLLNKGVDISIKDNAPIKHAIYENEIEIINYLLDNGVDINLEEGKLFYIAWDCLKLDICKLLVERGIDIQKLLKRKKHPIELRNFLQYHFPDINVDDMRTYTSRAYKKAFNEAITWDFNKLHSEQRYKEDLDAVMNAKVGDVLNHSVIYQYVEYLTDQAGKYEYSFVDGDLAERLEEYNKYVLKELLLDTLDLDEWELDKDIAEEYRLKYLKGKEYPPIVVDAEYCIIDGIHRANGLKKAGLTKILAFVGTNK